MGDLDERIYRQEWWKIGTSVLTPVAIVFLGFYANNLLEKEKARLDRDVHTIEDKRRVVAELGANLNRVYVYVQDVGDYKAYSPTQIIDLKRQNDRAFYVYCPYWSRKTVEAYRAFDDATFLKYQGVGRDAQIRASTGEKIAGRRIQGEVWDPRWNDDFTGSADPQVAAHYGRLATSMLGDAAEAGLHTDNACYGD